MRMTTKSMVSWVALAALAVFAAPPPAGAQPDDEAIRQTVARVSYVEGDASFSRGDDPDNWQPAAVNVPMTIGDRVYTGNGARVELQTHGSWVRLAPGSDLTVLNLTDDVRQFSLTAGTATIRVRGMDSNDVFEVDTPNSAVTLETPGTYRVDVDQDGNSRVAVRRGEVTVAAEGGQIPVSTGSEITIQGLDNPYYDVEDLSRPDAWDSWVSSRDVRQTRFHPVAYVSADVVGAEDLDRYGRWDDIPSYGHCWTPATVEAGWTPYRDGQWLWEDPWGWTWVGAEPWGWAPYHYGRWVTYSSRWYWVPVGPRVAVTYSPALVAFVGGGPGWSASVAIGGGGGYVGWFPLAPSDPFVPWWGDRRERRDVNVNVNVTNVTYVNRTYVTVVNQNTFVSGARISNNFVRDPQIVRQVVSAPIVRGTVPIVPTTASLRAVAVAGARPAPRPPAAIVNRAVVTRVAPPPAPAPFQAKMRVIQENRGAPVAPSVAARLSEEAHGGARAAVPVRPAAASPGQIGLQPRREGAAVRPQAVTAPHGKALATTERPFVATPGAAATPNAAPAPRVAPGAVVRSQPTRGGGPPAQRPSFAPPPPAASGNAAPPAAAPGNAPTPPPPGNNPRPESWRQRVPPGQEKKTPEAQPVPPPREAPPERRVAPPPPPPERELPPGRRVAPPPANSTETPPPPRRQATPPPEREIPPPPPGRQVAPPPGREAPPPRGEVTPPPAREGPPSRAESDKSGGRGQAAPRAKANDKKKEKDKENKDKEKEPPPPPPSI